MAYRLEQALHSHPDPLLAIARIGLLSDLELWLGIIVACIPTTAPFIRTYIEPHVLRLSRKLNDSSLTPSKEINGAPLPTLKTFGSPGTNGRKGGSNYTELSESFTDDVQFHDSMRLMAIDKSNTSTAVVSDATDMSLSTYKQTDHNTSPV